MPQTVGPMLPNVTAGTEQGRVREMLDLIGRVLPLLDGAGAAPSSAVPRFLLRVAWHEGDRLRARAQYNGPARSFFQFEAHRAKDAGDYARARGWLNTLAQIVAMPEATIAGAITALPAFNASNPNLSARFPDGNTIKELLETNDSFGIALARIAFKKVSAAIPADLTDQAAYWYTHWKISGGNPDALQAAFKANAEHLEGLLGTA